MGKFRNGELGTGFIDLSVNFRDFALHYEWPPTDVLSLPLIKGSLARRRWSTSSSFSSATVTHADSTAARFLASNPRRRLQNVLSRQLHDLALRGSRRSAVVMESRAWIDRDRIIGNTVGLAAESIVNSPLRNLPIRLRLSILTLLSRQTLRNISHLVVTNEEGHWRALPHRTVSN